MCTIVVLHEAHTELPLVVAANRDEFLDRAATPPRRVLDAPAAWAGLDAVAGGTWMGATEGGFFVGVTNQRSHQPPDRALRSRGQLALAVLARGSVAAAEAFLAGVDARDYNDFNLIFGEPGRVTVAYGRRTRARPLELEALPPGVHVLANDRLGSPEFPKAERAAVLVRPALSAPWPVLRARLEATLADRERPPLEAVPAPPLGSTFTREIVRELQAICIRLPRYGTRSSTVLAADGGGLRTYRFADGPPDQAPFHTVWSRDP